MIDEIMDWLDIMAMFLILIPYILMGMFEKDE
jgi:hypothetical protein